MIFNAEPILRNSQWILYKYNVSELPSDYEGQLSLSEPIT